ncbi:hypothetical protein SAMN05216378_3369 [Paenibacillus catalpae]|uniref:Uncharacterized protein n=1 Tax=Paenibacillus catalpae TaxID=1045775 RepID=A0A1I2B4Y0_9BACL|nr:hypothetical protein [Paenibacillus catalpae]SFE51037.1 hypothetical protein SAMN05216378_3369 [Paenibacillus catalpae]
MIDRQQVGFAAIGSLMSILFFMIVNFLTTPSDIWFIYPAFVLLFWPLSLASVRKGYYKLYSLLGSLLVIILMLTINYMQSPEYPWFVYAVFPVIWWPIVMYSGSKAKTLTFAVIAGISAILYYSILNAVMSPDYPWAIYPAFAVIWWPLALYYVRKKQYYSFSISASSLMIAFFITVNVVSSPDTIWAIYPIFAVLWWPLSMYYFQVKRIKN